MIQPNDVWWDRADYLKTSGGRRLPTGFQYTSDVNPAWMTRDALGDAAEEGGDRAMIPLRAALRRRRRHPRRGRGDARRAPDAGPEGRASSSSSSPITSARATRSPPRTAPPRCISLRSPRSSAPATRSSPRPTLSSRARTARCTSARGPRSRTSIRRRSTWIRGALERDIRSAPGDQGRRAGAFRRARRATCRRSRAVATRSGARRDRRRLPRARARPTPTARASATAAIPT